MNDGKFDSLRRDLTMATMENRACQYVIRGLCDTQRIDKVFNSTKQSVKELEILLKNSEAERSVQQKTIFDVMNIIKIGGGMVPKV